MVEVNGKVWDADRFAFHGREAKHLVYLASGTFNEEQLHTYNAIKDALIDIEAKDQSEVCTFLPMEDGYLLDSFKDNPPEVLHEVFKLDVRGMDASNIIVVNTTPDTGTQFELGYAEAMGLPIVLCTESTDELDRFYSSTMTKHPTYKYAIKSVWETNNSSEDLLKAMDLAKSLICPTYVNDRQPSMTTLVVASDSNVEAMSATLSAFSSAFQIIGRDLELIMEPTKLDHDILLKRLLTARNVVVCVDDRPALAGFIVGFCYACGIPVITFSMQEYPINLMLQESIRYHAVGHQDITYALRQLTSAMGAGGLKKSYQIKTY